MASPSVFLSLLGSAECKHCSVPVLLTCGLLMLEMPHDAWSIIRFGEIGRGRLKTASTASTNLLVSHFRSLFQNNF